MPAYAEKTSVTIDHSRGEIERILRRYGASMFAYGWRERQAVIEFAANDRRLRFTLVLPLVSDEKFAMRTEQRGAHLRVRATAAQREEMWDQACRQKWRALVLVIKAKLESVESGIATFEEEFLANVILPDGATVAEFLRPQIARAYETGEMPPMLPALGRG